MRKSIPPNLSESQNWKPHCDLRQFEIKNLLHEIDTEGKLSLPQIRPTK